MSLPNNSNSYIKTCYLRGPIGPTGPTGPSSITKIKINSTKTGLPGTEASVINIGDEDNMILDFTIPCGVTGPQGLMGPTGPQGKAGIQGERGLPGVTGPIGETGSTGPKGEQGEIGPSPRIKIGTVVTGEPGSKASVTLTEEID